MDPIEQEEMGIVRADMSILRKLVLKKIHKAGKGAQFTREGVCHLLTEEPRLDQDQALRVFYSLLVRGQLVYNPDPRIKVALYSLPRRIT